MNKNLKKKIFSFALIFVFALALATPALADVNSLLWGNQLGNVQTNVQLGNADPRLMAASFIKILLSFLGIIALIIVVIGGFQWMISAGSDEKIKAAKDMIVAGVIGLLIILASYGISIFVMDALYNATNAG